MAQCPTPFEPKGTGFKFPCGSCLICKKRRASGWGFRLSQQSKISSNTFFITLTYDTDHINITKNGFMSLYKLQLRSEFKRIRQSYYRYVQKEINAPRGYKQPTDSLWKYYAVGEYGGLKHRPHYHIISFNLPLDFIITKKWAKQALNNRDTMLKGKYHFYNPDFWPHGTITVGETNRATVNYTLKYISKDNSRIPMHKRDDREKEFAIMSKGLGLNYITENTIKWHYADMLNRCYLTIDGGVKIAIPRYYKKRLYDEEMLRSIAQYNEQKDNEFLKSLTPKRRDKEMTIRQAAATENHLKLKRQLQRDKNSSKL